jgi:hypothetical protein
LRFLVGPVLAAKDPIRLPDGSVKFLLFHCLASLPVSVSVTSVTRQRLFSLLAFFVSSQLAFVTDSKS